MRQQESRDENHAPVDGQFGATLYPVSPPPPYPAAALQQFAAEPTTSPRFQSSTNDPPPRYSEVVQAECYETAPLPQQPNQQQQQQQQEEEEEQQQQQQQVVLSTATCTQCLRSLNVLTLPYLTFGADAC